MGPALPLHIGVEQIRLPDRDPPRFCDSELDRIGVDFVKTQPDQIWISKLH